jgi:hypothetical protein
MSGQKKNKKEGRPKDETIRKDYKHSSCVFSFL